MTDAVAQTRVLVADDHPVVRAGVAWMINRQPDMTVVAQAATGREAVALHRSLRPHIALIDLRMPDLDGAEAVRRIRASDPDARVLVLTTYDTDEDIQLALRAGAGGYLLKDAPEAELIEGVRGVLAGRTCIAPAVAAKLADRLRRVQLTAREMDVLKLMAEGRSNKEIAAELSIVESTVKLHANNLFGKLGVQSRTEAMKVALQRGLIRLPE